MSGLLRNRWLLGGVGIAAFAGVVWTVGDLLSLGGWRPLEGEAGRAILIALAAGAWIAMEAWRARQARRENERLLDVLAGGGAGDSAARAAREVALLRQRFEEAAGILKAARFRGPDGEQRFVHELPWYMFIGAPGSGKTTALVNSGLKFPLKEKLAGPGGDPSLAGVGGTRNCDWWFTEDAVLLDTAGRYTTQDSDLEADAAAWAGFLDLLKRFRPRRPLNGALVTLSVSDLMLWNEDQRRRYAWHVRARLAELHERLGIRFPVYLLVTKADLVAGFMEFFGELDGAARARVWGATFPADGAEGEPRARFEDAFRDLETRLNGELLERLDEERDLQRRAAAYRFPQELHGLAPLIAQFVEAAFTGVQGAPAPMLRGVYFTSGTQEGNPIDRVLGTLARGFRLEREGRPAAAAVAPGTAKSFFLMRLLREVIFPESGLAGSDAGLERRERNLRLAVYGGIAAVTVAIAGLWLASFGGNRSFVAQAAAAAAGAREGLVRLGPPRLGDEAELLKQLDALRALPGGYADQKGGASPAPGFGLSQAGKLGAQALRAYRAGLQDALLPRLALALEAGLQAASRSAQHEGGTELLEAYASLYSGAKVNVAAVEAAARRVWKLSDKENAALLAHLGAALEEGAPEMRHRRDEAIIREARQRLGARDK